MAVRLYDFLFQLRYVFTHIQPDDVFDIILVAGVFFVVFQVLRERRAFQLLNGMILLLVLGGLLLAASPLRAFNWLLGASLIVSLIALPYFFQDELRQAFIRLSRVGRRRGAGFVYDSLREAIVQACAELAERRTGALLVLEGQTALTEIIATGTPIHAGDVSAELLGNIFYPNTPLHDGAVIIQDGQLAAAGCILPVATERSKGQRMGTRHRAALGMTTEVPDALVIVVSEESGKISVAHRGRLHRGVSPSELREWLIRFQGQLTGEQHSFWAFIREVPLKTTLRNLVYATILATLAWVAIIYQVDPPAQETVRSVPLMVISPEAGLVVTSNLPAEVDVVVQSTRQGVLELDVESIQATLSLAGLAVGVHRVPIHVQPADPRDQVVSVEPAIADVMIEPQLEIDIAPKAVVLDRESLGLGYALGDVGISPQSVRVTGPQSLVEQVAEARLEISLNNRQNDFQEVYRVRLLDAQGQAIEGLQPVPAEVVVTVPIERLFFTRVVPIHANLMDNLPEGYEVTALTLTPAQVTLTGANADIDSSGEVVETAPIDLAEVRSTFSSEVPLLLPQGVIAIDDLGERINNVFVEVTVRPVSDYLTLTVAPTPGDDALQNAIVVTPQEVTVLIIGPEPLLGEIAAQPGLVTVTMDLSGLEEGVHLVPLQVSAPEDVQIRLFPAEVRVTIQAPESQDAGG